jgi:hypothetical protein
VGIQQSPSLTLYKGVATGLVPPPTPSPSQTASPIPSSSASYSAGATHYPTVTTSPSWSSAVNPSITVSPTVTATPTVPPPQPILSTSLLAIRIVSRTKHCKSPAFRCYVVQGDGIANVNGYLAVPVYIDEVCPSHHATTTQCLLPACRLSRAPLLEAARFVKSFHCPRLPVAHKQPAR